MNQNLPSETRPTRKPRRKQVKEVKPAPVETSFLASLASYGSRQKLVQVNRPKNRKVPAPKTASAVLAQLQASVFGRIFSFLRARAVAPKQLRVAETVSLGEKRFVAIVQVEGQRFLIGGGASGVSLLTELDRAPKSKTVALNDAITELAG